MDNPHEQVPRELDGMKVAFVDWETYTKSMFTASMFSTTKATGADVTFLLAPGVKPEDVTDEQLREMIQVALGKQESDEQQD